MIALHRRGRISQREKLWIPHGPQNQCVSHRGTLNDTTIAAQTNPVCALLRGQSGQAIREANDRQAKAGERPPTGLVEAQMAEHNAYRQAAALLTSQADQTGADYKSEAVANEGVHGQTTVDCKAPRPCHEFY